MNFNDAIHSYSIDLSARKVLNTNNYLAVQFPAERNVVLSQMSGSIFLSVIFSLLIIGAFYYSIRLILAQKKITEIRNDFVNNMTHELKTPIATISLAVEALNNPMVKNNEGMFNDYRRILKEENNKLNHHVERVLQMSLYEKGKLHMDLKRMDVVELLESCINAYQLRIKEKSAQVSFNSKGPVFIYGDQEHLRSAFNNLLDNSLKYSGDNCEIKIDVITNGNKVSILFKDNGIGINKEHQEKIFEKFYRVQGGNLHDVKGFGLGLSYVRSIVEAHEGAIAVKSEKDKGSEFLITLKADA